MTRKLIFASLLFILAFNFNAGAQQLKGDPWIFQVYQQVYLRPPTAWELNINNYNLGSWNSYGDLLYYITQYQNALKADGYIIKTTRLANNQSAAIFYQNGIPVASALISNTSGTLVGNDGASLVGNDGASLIGIDGGTLRNLAVASFADQNTKYVQSSQLRILKSSGRGRIILKKR